MLKVDYYFGARKEGGVFGIGRYKEELYSNIPSNVSKQRIEYNIPNVPKLGRVLNFFDFLTCSPSTALKHRRKDAIAHIMSHSEAYLLNYFKFNKSIVTCYDLIPLLFTDCSFLARKKVGYAYKGMVKADRIIAIAEFTKQEIVKHLRYPAERVSVAYPGVDHEHYKQLPKKDCKAVAKRYGLSPDYTYVLYVGNEEPRMNLFNTLKSFGMLKKKMPDVKFLKVGRPNFPGMREKLLERIKGLHLEEDVIFTDYISEKDLPYIYNFAGLFVYPIFYTGFGMPPAEAMACGTPVITSNTTTLPEVVGDAAIMVDPYDCKSLFEKMYLVLNSKKVYNHLASSGLRQAKEFSWKRCAQQTMQAYEEL